MGARVSEDHLAPAERAAAGSYVGCIAGALSRAEYLDGLAAAGFTDAQITGAAIGTAPAVVIHPAPALATAPETDRAAQLTG